MLIIGCDFHPGFQQVAIFDNTSGEIQEGRLGHRAEAEQFYRGLAGQPVRVGMEACGHYPWFERLLAGNRSSIMSLGRQRQNLSTRPNGRKNKPAGANGEVLPKNALTESPSSEMTGSPSLETE
jgi:hypothetical protein